MDIRIKIFRLLLLCLFLFINLNNLSAEEGMYPLSEIQNLDLKSAGLKIRLDEIYNPKGTSLVDA